jgi:hypothetical protein
MPGLRLLLRRAPFVVGAVAVGVSLRRRREQRKALPAGVGVRELPAGEPPEPAVGGANDAPNGERAEPARRFQREPIDIVTIVDDLLQAGR